MADNNFDLREYGIAQVGNTKIQDALADHVKDSYRRAKEHKDNTGITGRLLRNLRAKKCEYEPEDLELFGKGNDVYVGVAALKARAAESWLLDIIVNNIDKPWTLDATPEPDLPERLKEEVVNALILELPDLKTFEAVKDRASQLKSAVQGLSQKEAAKSVKRMETRIEDQMAEGGWIDVFTKFVGELSVFPTALVRSPLLEGNAKAVWKGNKFKVEHGQVLRVRNIPAFDAFPSPNSSSCQTGDFFCEKKEYSPADMHNMIGTKSFSAANVRQALDRYSEGFNIDAIETSEQDALEGKEQALQTNKVGKGIDVIIYNGKVHGQMLADNGVIVEDIQKYYECEVWVAGDYTLRAVINPNPLGIRPIQGTSYVKIPGSFWGHSVIDTVYDTGRACNAAIRAIIRNMGYASGPIGEVDYARLGDNEDVSELIPYKIFQVGPDITGTGAPAFRWHNVSAVMNDLMAVFEKFMKIADDLSGVPAYVLGNPQVAGAGRTLGGLSMLMGNAAKGIKMVQLNIDKELIVPVVYGFWMYNMQNDPDPGIKSDAIVVARGATGLLARELAQTRTVEILQLITPYVDKGLIDKTALDYILREVFKNTGMDVDRIIPDPDKDSNLQDIAKLLGNGQADALQGGTSTPTALPTQSQPPPTPSNLAPFARPVNLAQGS